MSEDAKSFFDEIVAEAEGEIAESANTDPNHRQPPETNSDIADSSKSRSTQKVVHMERDNNANNQRAKGKSKSSSRDAITPSPELKHAYSQSRIQKTVRFRPKLIAELQKYFREQEAAERDVPSFQDVQNDALELWLQKHVRPK